MTASLATVSYIGSTILFILSLGGLSNPETARRGNVFGMIGIFLASGTLGDPTTTNETLTGFFDRKTIGLDRGYITYNPVAHKWLSLTGGKFAFPWIPRRRCSARSR